MGSTTAATLPEQLEARVHDDADRHLAAVGGDWMSIGQVRNQSLRLAAGLHAFGVTPGDRVASIMPNRPEAVDLFLACAELGAVHVPLNVFLKGEFLRYQLLDADPEVLIVDDAAFEMASDLVRGSGMSTRIVALDGNDGAPGFGDLYAEPERSWPAPTPDTLLSILYTSGTTGPPKGCTMTHGYFLHFPLAHEKFGWFKPSDTSISTLPLYHGFGLSGFMAAVVIGCRIRFEPSFSASTLISRAREEGATQLWAVGAIGTALLATPPSPGDKDHSLERAVFIPMAPRAQHEFEDRFGVDVLAEGYGQTEVLPATMDGVRSGRDKPSAGRRLPWLDVEVVDDQDRVLPEGESGEIVVRPREPHSMFSGYWRKEAATLESWRNLWHHTGDLGYFDADGMLYFVDRKKDAIRRRGENVSSVELEMAILKHPAVAQVAVHAAPSELSEDEIKACIVLEPDKAGETNIGVTPESLFGFFRDNLPYYAVPRYVELMDELPANAVGRILKHKLRDDWDSPKNIDFEALGLTIERSERR